MENLCYEERLRDLRFFFSLEKRRLWDMLIAMQYLKEVQESWRGNYLQDLGVTGQGSGFTLTQRVGLDGVLGRNSLL